MRDGEMKSQSAQWHRRWGAACDRLFGLEGRRGDTGRQSASLALTSLLCIACIVVLNGCFASRLADVPDVDHSSGTYARYAVAADHPQASWAGALMLEMGGNAVDAAVATSFALSVVRPYACGIGGGGFMLIHVPPRDGQPAQAIAINYRETCPAAIDRDYFVRLRSLGIDDASRYGAHAVAVPGTVAGLLYALEHYGTLDRRIVMTPAILMARHGTLLDKHARQAMDEINARGIEHSDLVADVLDTFDRIPEDRHWLAAAMTRSNSQQEHALDLIAEHGADAFYRGEIADAIVARISELGGAITHQDLANYQVSVTEPLRASFAEYELLTMPPPSSGGIALQQILGLFARRFDRIEPPAQDSADYVHLLAECFKHAFADRAEWLADEAFVDVPIARLTSDAYLDELAARIDPSRSLDRFDYGSVTPAGDDGGTSHFCVIDRDGMAVACTETINLEFGSLVVVPGCGFALNNQMDDFTTIPGESNYFGLKQSDRNLPQPGKRPLSSMSPTIVLKDGKAVLIAGSSGGPRIITATAQCILDCLVFDLTPHDAVGAPRFHHQWMPDELRFEPLWKDESVRRELESRGHVIGEQKTVGNVQMIHVRDGVIHAASDPRTGGAPAGH